MKTIIKILIGISLLFLLLGSTVAVNIEDLKVPIGYEKEDTGIYYLNTDVNSKLFVEKVDQDGINEYFKNHTEYTVMDIGNNTYFYMDSGLKTSGVEEVVEIDGTQYMVSFDNSEMLSLQDVDIKMAIEDLATFNEYNDFEPVPV